MGMLSAADSLPLKVVSWRREGLAPQLWEATALFVSAAAMTIVYAAGLYSVVSAVGPALLTVIMAIANWQLARFSPAAVWTPLFALRLAVLVNLGAGALLPLLDEEIYYYIQNIYPYTDEESAKVNLIWLISTTVLINSCRFASGLRDLPRSSHSSAAMVTDSGTLKIGLVFFGLGFGYLAFFEFPASMGWYHARFPGSVSLALQAAEAVGIFLIALWSFEGRGLRYFTYIPALLASIILGLILYNKTIIIGPLLFVGLAMLSRGVTVARGAVVTIILVIVFAVLQPMISQSRATHVRVYGHGQQGFTGGTLSERLSFSLDYLEGVRHDDDKEPAFQRLTYIAPAAFVVTQYDLGLPSGGLANTLSAIIPRVIWPEKPEVSAAGREVYYRLRGRDSSRLAMTAFADLYWNIGWIGLISALVPLGALLWLATQVAHRIVLTRDWLMMPVCLMLFRIGLAMDGDILSNILVPGVVSVAAYGLLSMAKRIMSPDQGT